MRKELAAALAAGVMLVGGAVFTANSAMAGVPDSATVVTENVSRPDSGKNGTWAGDTFTRTVTVTPVKDKVNEYQAVFADSGTFETIKGKSPEAGKDLAAGIRGTFKGGATYLFTTATALSLDTLKPYKADAYPSTGEWVGKWLGNSFVSGDYAKDANGKQLWGWIYDTGCEKWTNAGTGSSGDVTLKCATPTAPRVTEATCEAAGELVIPQVTGVRYTTVTKPNGDVKVTATARPGYKLPEKTGGWTWTLSIPGKKTCESPSPSPSTSSPTASPTTTAPGTGGGGTTSPSQTTDPAADPTTSNAAGELPVTGESGGVAKMVGMLSIGGILIAGGGLMFMWARRRRDADTVESA